MLRWPALRIWLVTVGEPLPSDPGHPRLLRTGILARTLAARGHEVLWWSSAFDHSRKVQRAEADHCIDLQPRFRLSLLHAPGYRHHVSLSRIRHHRATARAFARLAPAEARPDVIVSSLPTLELCEAAVDYGRSRGVPVAIDIRDLWPDIFLELAPRGLKTVARCLLDSMFRSARRICAGATAVLATSPDFVDWGLRNAARARKPTDADFPLGYAPDEPSSEALRSAEEVWDRRGIRAERAGLRACFFGTFGRQFDFDTVLDALRRLRSEGCRVTAVLCGEGDRLAALRTAAADLEDVVTLPGWVDAASIRSLMKRSDVGLAPYFSTPSFESNIPNKAIEYFSAGLPVLSSLRGVLQRTLDEVSGGWTYPNGDAAALAGLLSRLGGAREDLAARGRNALALFHDRYQGERVYGAMADHVERLAR